MRNYWIRIGVGAVLVFGVGYAAYATGRGFVSRIDSDADLVIPLGAFVPFKLDGAKVGTFRSLIIQRSAPTEVTGFALRVRLSDEAAFEKARDCKLTVSDPSHLDERTTFFCLSADSGYQAFGEIRLELRIGSDTRGLIQPLFLPDSVVEHLRHRGRDSMAGSPFGDSLAQEIRARVRVQSRVYSDSIAAAALERSAHRMQERADSIRARTSRPPPTP